MSFISDYCAASAERMQNLHAELLAQVEYDVDNLFSKTRIYGPNGDPIFQPDNSRESMNHLGERMTKVYEDAVANKCTPENTPAAKAAWKACKQHKDISDRQKWLEEEYPGETFTRERAYVSLVRVPKVQPHGCSIS